MCVRQRSRVLALGAFILVLSKLLLVADDSCLPSSGGGGRSHWADEGDEKVNICELLCQV